MPKRTVPRGPAWTRAVGALGAACLALAVALPAAGCSRGPITESRETLGTIVTITAYGDDTDAVREAVNSAFATLALVDGELDAYNPTSPISVVNADPYEWHALSANALAVLDATERLGATDSFSSALYGVALLYDFEGGGVVPDPATLTDAVAAAQTLERDGGSVRFAPPEDGLVADETEGRPPGTPGLDFGGAAKGLALDRAIAILSSSDAVDAVLISTGSTSISLGDKPDGEPWRIGIEDPRDPATIVAVVEARGACVVSTSGDYQRFFERDGVYYHHILDPATGEPARGVRSLTVIGTPETLSALDADILSTALFVMGPERASAYAEDHEFALYTVDAEGRALIAPAPEGATFTLVEESEPSR